MTSIWRIFICVAINICLCTYAKAGEVVLYDGGVTFVTPEDFTEMPMDVVKAKYPIENRPHFFYGNEDYTVSIAIRKTEQLLELSDLESLKSMMEETLPRVIPNLEWISRRIMIINNRKWLLLELESSAIDTNIHNIMLFTSYKGKMLGFNFNSTVEQFKKYQNDLLSSISSITIDDSAP